MSKSTRSRWAVRLAASLILATAGCTAAMGPEYTRVPQPRVIRPFVCDHEYGPPGIPRPARAKGSLLRDCHR
jgi:hypothetical protein